VTTYDEVAEMPLQDVLHRYQALDDRDSMARSIAILKTRGTYTPNEHVNEERFPPLTVAERLEMLALGENLARYFRHPAQVHHAVLAGATWEQIAAATGGDAGRAREAYRAWAESQHDLRQQFPGGTIGPGDDEYAAALERAGGANGASDG
jgi:hypothetical protein